jgi:hypothetical protein
MRISIFIILLALLASCSDDDSVTPVGPMGFQSDDEVLPTVVPELRPLYLSFEQAAADRGITINLTELGITGNIVELGDNSVLGLCRRSDTEPNRVAVDISAWINSSDSFRELIVFHELGHCVLDREHLDDQEDGICQSIMHSGLTDCVVPLDDPDLREVYLDELFFN